MGEGQGNAREGRWQGGGHGDDERGVKSTRDRDHYGVRLKYLASWVYQRKR